MGRKPFRKRKHTPEFKRQAVQLMEERLASGLTLERVSEELEVGPDLLRVWRKQVASAPDGATVSEIFPGHGRKRTFAVSAPVEIGASIVAPEEELRRLRRENERLRQERDFLKKAAAFFAKESR
jgi:transposase